VLILVGLAAQRPHLRSTLLALGGAATLLGVGRALVLAFP
jgi:hypothetical protein